MKQNSIITITNDYPTDKYNLLIPVRTMQELSSMQKIIMQEVTIDPDCEVGSDVYVQQKGYKDLPDKLSLNKTALAKLMTAAGIEMIESRPIIPSTHMTAIGMAKAIGKPVQYDTRDVAHEVVISVPQPSGERKNIRATKEIIIEDLKAEYIEQKKNMYIWEDGKKRKATEKEKMEAVEKQLTQFMGHKRAQIETKTLNRALREALMIKSTYTAEELNKPFVVAQIVPNLDQPEIKQILLNKYAAGVVNLFGITESNENTPVALPKEEKEIPLLNAGEVEVITDNQKEETNEEYVCKECGSIIQDTDKATAKEIAEFTKETFKKELCPDCFKEENEKLKQKIGGK